MLNIFKDKDLSTGEERILVEGETTLEEKFILWISCEEDISRIRKDRKEALVFDPLNDIEQLRKNITSAFEDFKIRFNYAEIPSVIGMPFSEGTAKIIGMGLFWTIEKEEPSTKYPQGYIINQSPQEGITSTPYYPIRLIISDNSTQEEPLKPNSGSIEEDEVFKRFLS